MLEFTKVGLGEIEPIGWTLLLRDFYQNTLLLMTSVSDVLCLKLDQNQTKRRQEATQNLNN
jgi:hypothetical protein